MTVHSLHLGNSCHVFRHNKARFHLELVLRFVFRWFRYIPIWLIFCWYIIQQEDEVSPSQSALSRSARAKTATPSSEHGRDTSPISSYHSRESSRHSHSRKTTRSFVENERSTSEYGSRQSEVSQTSSLANFKSRSRSRSPCVSSGGTCQTASKDLLLELNHNC